MIKFRELLFIVLGSLVIGYVVSFAQPITYEAWAKYSMIGFLLLAVNVLAKKLAAAKLGCEAEITPWQVRRFGFHEDSYFKMPLPMWVIWPIFMIWATVGAIWWLVVLQFDAVATTSKVRHKYAEITEWDFGLIAAAGIVANLIFAAAAAYFGYSEVMAMNLWFVFFNMLPLPNYDGGKIFFGGRFFYMFMLIFSIAVIFLLHITDPLTTGIASAIVACVAVVMTYALLRRR